MQGKNLQKFSEIIESQQSLFILEQEINKKMALNLSESSSKGLSRLPQVEKIIDDLALVK